MIKRKSKEASIANLKKIFSKNPEASSLTLREVYIGYGRDLTDENLNKNWIANLLTNLRFYKLVLPVYGRENGKRVLSGISLTMAGKNAISPDEEIIPVEEKSGADGDVVKIMRAVAKLKAENPDFDIDFNIKLKGV